MGTQIKGALVVEGDGEVKAVPAIWYYLCGCIPLLDPPYRLDRGRALKPDGRIKEEEWERVFQLLYRKGATLVLVLMDADDICPKAKALAIRTDLNNVITRLGLSLRIGFCLAEPEYEAWFLAGADFLSLGEPVTGPFPRDCKGKVTERMGRKYSPTTDQELLTKQLLPHLGSVARRAPSLDKLLREIHSLCQCASTF